MALLFTFGHCKSDCKSVCSRRMLCSKRWIGMSAGETLWRAFPEDQLLWVAGHPSLHKKTNAVLISEANMKWRIMWTHFHVKNDRMKLELQPETNDGFPSFPKQPMCIHVYPCVMCGFFTTIGKQRLIYGLTGGDGLEDGALAVAGECRISCWQVLRIFGCCGCVPVVWCFSETELL